MDTQSINNRPINDQPLNDQQKHQVMQLTDEYIRRASHELEFSFQPIVIQFDLKGRTAGMYVHKNEMRIIRYNPYLFAKYFTENISVTIPHEVAHYLVDVLYGITNIKPHGKEWKNMMLMFKANASVTCNFDLAGIPTKRYKLFDYLCQCRSHYLTTIRHNRTLRGIKYCCRHCRTELQRTA